MRIGLLTSLNIEQWTPQYQRTIVQKQVPGFVVVQTYDIVARNNILTVKGYLTGTSASDLATKAMTLRGYANQKKVIWIDASDQYQGYCELVRIIELDGPNIDASKGILTTDFTLKAAMLLPWGTTFSNPFASTGIVLKDLNGQGLEYMLNPLEMDCNFTISNPNTSSESFGWEFILDNQNAFTNATSVQQYLTKSALGTGTASPTNPVETNGASLPSIGVTNFDSITADATHNAENFTHSFDGGKSTPGNNTYYGMGVNFGTTGINLSSYDRLRLWFLCNQAGQQTYAVGLIDTSGNWIQWNFSLQAASVWMNLELALASYSNHSAGAISLSAIQYVYAFVLTAVSYSGSELDIWFNDVRAEIGYINHCFDTSGWTQEDGTVSFSNDKTIYKISPQLSTYTQENWGASLKMSGAADTGGHFGGYYTLPVTPWNVASPIAYDFIVLWVRSDFGGNGTGNIGIWFASSGAFSNSYDWEYDNLNANQWYRLVIPLRCPLGTSGSPSLSSFEALTIRSYGAASQTTNTWLSEIGVDVGNNIILECLMPNNLQSNTTQDMLHVWTWNGSSYSSMLSQKFSAAGPDTFSPGVQAFGDSYTLDGNTQAIRYANFGGNVNYAQCYSPNTANNTGYYLCTNDNYVVNIIYQPVWGTNNRWALMFRLPPATSDTVSGNLPSNDLSGFQAINKVRLKIVVYVSNEDTTYLGN